jgi:SAM-dependent methyltransferase
MANFDGVARWYRWLEYAAFGRALERCRFALLPELAEARRVLILGEGDGRFLQQLLQVNPRAWVDVVEASSQMVKLARGRLTGRDRGRVHFHQADARSWNFPRAEYDAVVTCFFLDCFTPETLAGLMPRISESAAPGASWLLAEFAESPSLRSRVWLGAMHSFFRATTHLEARRLGPFADLLSSGGWRRFRQVAGAGGLMNAELWRECFSQNGT